ncbi:A-kinase anchor protein 12-like [Scleropages formosus]|uniref:A-kinase anchor protein 12-like n=1 Tax=Scleropages formosus TaxID=113540 RepID=A0A8C9RSS2_SCLFO|nr:A-kinase anchor protein 12-like [Scleropages formosus]
MGASNSAEVRSAERRGGARDVRTADPQKNGQITSLVGTLDDRMEQFDCQSEEKALVHVSQTDTIVSQKEGNPELTEVLHGAEVPEVNVGKEEKKSSDGKTLTVEKGREEGPADSSEVGFKKLFRAIGLKFTLKKDQSDSTETQEERKEDKGETSSSKEAEDAQGVTTMDDVKEQPVEESEAGGKPGGPAGDLPTDKDGGDTVDLQEATEEVPQKSQADISSESPYSPPQDTLSPLKRFFTQGIFSSLRKTESSATPIEEEIQEEVTAMEEPKETEEIAELSTEESEKTTIEATEEPQQEESTTPETTEAEHIPETVIITEETLNEDEIKSGVINEVKIHQTVVEEKADTLSAEDTNHIKYAEDEEDVDDEETSSEEDFPGKSFEAELLSSIEKQIQKLPLKQLFTGTCRKRFSSKKQTDEEEAEPSLSPEDSEEHLNDVSAQMEGVSEGDEGGSVLADKGKKTDAFLHWASFKKLITPMKNLQRASGSEEEVTNLIVTEEEDEMKPTEDEQAEFSTEEPKKKASSSVSWESLICVGSSKKRARKGSGGGEEKPEESQELIKEPELEISQEVDHEQTGGDGGSTWVSLKKLIPGSKKKKSDDQQEQVSSDQAGSDTLLVDLESPPAVPVSESSALEPVDITLNEDIPQKQADVAGEVVTEDTIAKIPSEELSQDHETPDVTTEVPQEYEVKQAEAVLQEAVESISLIPVVLPVTLADTKVEVVLVSVSSQILESVTKEEKTVLAAHEMSEVTAICTGFDSKAKSQVAAEIHEADIKEQKIQFQEAGAQVQQILEEKEKFPEQNGIEEVSQAQIEVKEQISEAVNDLQEAVPVKEALVSSGEGEIETLEVHLVAEDTPKPVAEGPVVSNADEFASGQSTNVIEVSSAKREKSEEDHIKDTAGDAPVVEAVIKSDVDVALTNVTAAVEDVCESIEKTAEESFLQTQATAAEEHRPDISPESTKEAMEIISETEREFFVSNVHHETEVATITPTDSLATSIITKGDKTEEQEVSETETVETGPALLEENVDVREVAEGSKKAEEELTEEEVRHEAKEDTECDKSHTTREEDSHEEEDAKVELEDQGLDHQATEIAVDGVPFELVSVRDVSSQTDEVEVYSSEPETKEDPCQEVSDTKTEERATVELQKSEDAEQATTAKVDSGLMEAIVPDSQCQMLLAQEQCEAIKEEESQVTEHVDLPESTTGGPPECQKPRADILQTSVEGPQQSTVVPVADIGSETVATKDMQYQEATSESIQSKVV